MQDMRPAYIVSAYKRPDLLIRMVQALEGMPVAIHIDRKSAIFEQARAALGSTPNVTFLRRHTCHWGLFGHVRASLEGMRWFLGTDCDYAILLTGQCYPLKPQSEIKKDLDDLSGRSVIELSPFPKVEWGNDDGGYRRLDRFYFRTPPTTRRGYWRLDWLFLRFPSGVRLLQLKPWVRKMPFGLHPYGGSGYWCLSRRCVQQVLRFVRDKPSILRFFSTTYVPDEMFFQTILANSPCRAELVNSAIHYLDWSDGGANPAIVTSKNLDAAFASGSWFTRKLDDPEVLDLIDDVRLRSSQPFAPAPWRKAERCRSPV